MDRADPKKEAELFIVREFLEQLDGYCLVNLTPSEPPDAFADVVAGDKKLVLGIELRGYHVDESFAEDGCGSPGRRLHESWQRTQDTIRRFCEDSPDLRSIMGSVSLRDKKNPPPMSEAERLAEELVSLAGNNSPMPGGTVHISTFGTDEPFLGAYVRKVTLRHLDGVVCPHWHCPQADAANINVSPDRLVSIITEKARKAKQYEWRHADERWLLIAATGETVFNSGTPCPEFVEWDAGELKEACRDAAFDRIFFWDRIRNWYVEIWPSGELIQSEWRTGET